MKATRQQIKKANEIAARFSGWHEPHEIAAMYDELEKIGITTGAITNRRDFQIWDAGKALANGT